MVNRIDNDAAGCEGREYDRHANRHERDQCGRGDSFGELQTVAFMFARGHGIRSWTDHGEHIAPGVGHSRGGGVQDLMPSRPWLQRFFFKKSPTFIL